MRCRKRKLSDELDMNFCDVNGPRLRQGSLQIIAKPLLKRAKAYIAVFWAIRHARSSMGFILSLTGHVSVENEFLPDGWSKWLESTSP
uniref:Uncharacterized protein n=1 Tax=Noccaea caerulescens TaxID=107243 RepID=A0A1J3CRM3_NOCCA